MNTHTPLSQVVVREDGVHGAKDLLLAGVVVGVLLVAVGGNDLRLHLALGVEEEDTWEVSLPVHLVGCVLTAVVLVVAVDHHKAEGGRGGFG